MKFAQQHSAFYHDWRRSIFESFNIVVITKAKHWLHFLDKLSKIIAWSDDFFHFIINIILQDHVINFLFKALKDDLRVEEPHVHNNHQWLVVSSVAYFGLLPPFDFLNYHQQMD